METDAHQYFLTAIYIGPISVLLLFRSALLEALALVSLRIVRSEECVSRVR